MTLVGNKVSPRETPPQIALNPSRYRTNAGVSGACSCKYGLPCCTPLKSHDFIYRTIICFHIMSNLVAFAEVVHFRPLQLGLLSISASSVSFSSPRGSFALSYKIVAFGPCRNDFCLLPYWCIVFTFRPKKF